MIPKKIHYCWLGGGKFSAMEEKCLASWRKYCPDYEIIRWDESNYDFTIHPYMRQALEAKKWGFVPDYARLDIVHKHGGIYLDTDVELVRTLDDLLSNKCFMGFESPYFVALGLGFGAEAGHPLLQEMMQDYDNYSFITPEGKLNMLPSPKIQTELLKKHGLKEYDGRIQTINGDVTVYPTEYFSPRSLVTKQVTLTENTFSIHLGHGSWQPWHTKVKGKIYKFLAFHAVWVLKLRARLLGKEWPGDK